MQRIRDERGAVGVVVALLMVPLIGFAAIAIDVSAMYAERQQLQSGADAGALAIAQDCGRGACGSTGQTAQTFATSNLNKASSTATVTSLTAPQVTVRNTGIKQHWFAPVLGVTLTSISASATVAWGSPTGGTAELPLAILLCEWRKQTGGGMPSGTTPTIISQSPRRHATPDCTGPSGTRSPEASAGSRPTPACVRRAASHRRGPPLRSGQLGSEQLLVQRPRGLAGKTVLLPIFDAYAGPGQRDLPDLRLCRLQDDRLSFGGQFNSDPSPAAETRDVSRATSPRFVDISEAFTFTARASPQLGASIVRFTQ